tara:strand:- start:4458 stop:5351 length:894 start_codon:yes stop_codon:yes gene_type:complete
MRIKLIFSFLLSLSYNLTAQGSFEKSSKGNDYIVVVNDGIQFSIATTYLIPGLEVNGENDLLTGNRESYSIVPQGRLGYAAELGFAHFPKWKGIPISVFRKSRIWDYFDWGLGYKVFSGRETTAINLLDPTGVSISSNDGVGSFKLGMFSARLSAHSLVYFGKKKIDKARKHFIDNAFGINFEYLPSSTDTTYKEGFDAYALPHTFQGAYNLQFHYNLGIGVRFNRAWMMIPTFEIPLIGFYKWNGLNAKWNWFSSQYWPVLFRLKFIKLFERVPKCGAYGDPSEMNFDKKFRSGNF